VSLSLTPLRLTAVKGVASVRSVDPDAGDEAAKSTHHFIVIAEEGQDPRADIFRMATQKGLTLLELRREKASLEDVFRTLTSGTSGRKSK